jgi:hypothetical protein
MSDVELMTRGTMDIQHLSTHGLLMFYQAVKLALDEDDGNPEDRPFQVRENSDWRKWSDEIASELDHRSVNFTRIDW